MEKLHYEKLLQITSQKRINNLIRNVYNSINLEAKHLAKKTVDRVECMARKPAYMTLKDHKKNYQP